MRILVLKGIKIDQLTADTEYLSSLKLDQIYSQPTQSQTDLFTAYPVTNRFIHSLTSHKQIYSKPNQSQTDLFTA
jgi:hypothetical protein